MTKHVLNTNFFMVFNLMIDCTYYTVRIKSRDKFKYQTNHFDIFHSLYEHENGLKIIHADSTLDIMLDDGEQGFPH